jgi:DNA recombination protein RmuC
VCQGVPPGFDLNKPFKNDLYVIFTITTSLAAAIIVAVIVWLILKSRQAALDERLRSKEEEAVRLNAELSALRADNARFATLNAQLSTQLEAERSAHERLTHEFKALSAEALQHNNESFLKLAQATLEKYQEGAKSDLAARQLAVETLVKPLKESLEKVDAKIGEIEKSRANAYGQLSEQLKSLGTAQVSLQAEAAKLSTALRSTTAAGTWGELQLRRVVEMSGMSAYCDFTEQQSANGGAFRADLVVRLPGGQQIVIDAKAPNDAYREAANASDETVRATKLAEHAAKVRSHIDALGAKNYWEQFQPSPEFVVLFLPGDQFLSGALQSDPTLIDRAIGKKVLLATPATLIALLKAAAYGWRQESVSKNAEAIADLGRELHDRVATFAEHIENVGSGLKSALGHYNKAVGSYGSTLLPGARKLAELGAKGTKELPAPDPIEVVPREIVKKS